MVPEGPQRYQLYLGGSHSLCGQPLPKPLRHRPSFAYGPVVKQIFAGLEQFTVACKKEGLGVAEGVELYEDPVHKKAPREQHDVRRPEVRRRLLLEAAEGPGPGVPNVYQFGGPCESFSDMQLVNHGTRSWSAPEGDGSQASEVEGNLFVEFTIDMCHTLHVNEKEFLVESSSPTGRYPKAWDLKSMLKLKQKTGAVIISVANCAYGLAPLDDADRPYLARRWWLVSKGLLPWAYLIARRCTKNHKHTVMEGSDGFGHNRTRMAAYYTPQLCEAWAKVIHAAWK